MFISDLAGMVIAPIQKVATIIVNKTVPENTSESGTYVLIAGSLIIGGLVINHQMINKKGE